MKTIFSKLPVLISVLVFFIPVSTYASASGVVIESFQISGKDSTQLHEEFITLKNVSENEASVSGCKIYKAATSAKQYLLYQFDEKMLRSNQTFKIAHADYTGTADAHFISGTSNTLSTSNSIVLTCGTATIDSVGYGESYYFEGTRLTNPSYGQIFIRDGEDSNNNFLDFILFVEPVVYDPNVGRILITEIVPSPDSGEEWVELYNPTSQTVVLSGLKLCDAMGSVHCYFFPDTAYLNPFEYKTYSQSETKITLNNSGDWVELRDSEDNLISDSGGDYGSADSGMALALFGDEFRWTKTITPASENIFTDIIEQEAPLSKVTKSTSKKVKKVTVKTATEQGTIEENEEKAVAGVAKTAEENSNVSNSEKAKDNSFLGYGLIVLAFVLLLGYNLWDQKDAVRKFYYKISRRDH